MKNTRFLVTAIIAASLAGLTFTSCDKKPQTPAGDGGANPAEAAKPDESSKIKAPAEPAAEVGDIAGAYGFVAKLPNDVEAFDASYRLHEIWTALANSKWAAAVLEIPPIKSDPNIIQMRKQWNSAQGEQIREILAQIFGNEWIVAMPAGFSDQFKPWMDLMAIYQSTILEGAIMSGMSGSKVTQEKMQKLIADAAPELVPALAKCDVPSMMFVAKAGKIRKIVDDLTKQLVAKVGVDLPPAFETQTFKVADKYEFRSISVSAKKLIAQFQEVQLELKLKQQLGDEATAKKVIAALSTKRAEIAWGWVDDNLVVSIGSNHDHVKFAGSEAGSALAIAAVAERARQFAPKKPTSLSYVSKLMLEKLGGGIEFAERFKNVAEELAGILKPDQIAAMVADARKLEARAKVVFKNTYDAQVVVAYTDAGLRMESFGGPRDAMLDSSKPLMFANLATPGTFLLFNGRTNGVRSTAVTDFIEEGVAVGWGWYEKYGRTMIPEKEREGAAMIEAMAVPMLKDFWKAGRKLGAALGDESAFVFDTVGVVPDLENAPPFLKEGKMPRLAYVVEMKDRAGVSAAWTSFAGLIKQIATLAGGAGGAAAGPDGGAAAPKFPEPQMKKEGDLEIHYVPLPVKTGDLLPHIAIAKDRWIISTSPSLSTEIASKPANSTGTALSGNLMVNFTALFDHAEAWLAVVDKNAKAIMGANAEGFQASKPLIDLAIKLARSLQRLEVKMFEEGGKSRISAHLKLQDLK